MRSSEQPYDWNALVEAIHARRERDRAASEAAEQKRRAEGAEAARVHGMLAGLGGIGTDAGGSLTTWVRKRGQDRAKSSMVVVAEYGHAGRTSGHDPTPLWAITIVTAPDGSFLYYHDGEALPLEALMHGLAGILFSRCGSWLAATDPAGYIPF